MNGRATIISDASFDPKSKCAAWAAWIKADGSRSEIFSGPIKREVRDSADAEMCALANAMAKADAAGFIEDGMEVMLQSDSVLALGIIRKVVPGVVARQHANSADIANIRRERVITGVRKEAAAIIAAIAIRRNLTIIIRHVRGHTRGDGRQWVNNQVDKAARRHMRAARKTVQ